MVGRTPEEAVEAFLDPLREAALCVTTQPLLGSAYKPAATPHVVAFAPPGYAVPLDTRFGRRSLRLFVSHRYRINETAPLGRERWRVSTIAYDYSLLDAEGNEILVYHWHPVDAGPVYPHLHLPGTLPPYPIGDRAFPVPLGDLHIPTAHVPFAAVIRLLVDEFGVPPRRPDADVRRVLNADG